jgi:SAM-dependent MidA family methyltransferase
VTDPTPPAPSAEFIAVFREHAGTDGAMPFARFMELALYHNTVGYYTRPRQRIGRTPGADFFTSTSLGPVFGELVLESCAALLGAESASSATFVEIGAEPAGPAGDEHAGVLASLTSRPPGVAHPFPGACIISLGQPFAIPAHAVVFSNELFDAQPCHRLVYHAGRWRESGVALRAGALEEILLPEPSSEIGAVLKRLPATAAEGYRIDLPLAARSLAETIAALPWCGLFIAFDYGKSWRELVEETPAGTVRAYSRQRQSNALLDQPGEQDLTCHVCWDWICEALTAHGFEAPVIESQEAFFVHHAARALSRLTTAEAGRFSSRKLDVMQLLHPGNMGHKFQVLWARRPRLPRNRT